MPNYSTTSNFALRYAEVGSTPGNKVNDFAAITQAMMQDADAALTLMVKRYALSVDYSGTNTIPPGNNVVGPTTLVHAVGAASSSDYNTSTGVWTCPAGGAGVYHFNAEVSVFGTGVSSIYAQLLKNGTPVKIGPNGNAQIAAGGGAVCPVAGDILCAVGDQVKLYINTSAAVSFSGAADETYLDIHRVA